MDNYTKQIIVISIQNDTHWMVEDKCVICKSGKMETMVTSFLLVQVNED